MKLVDYFFQILTWFQLTLPHRSNRHFRLKVPSSSNYTTYLHKTAICKHSMSNWKEKGLPVAIGALLVALLFRICNVVVKIRQRSNKPRSGKLEIISNPKNAKFEFVIPLILPHAAIFTDIRLGLLQFMVLPPIQSIHGVIPPPETRPWTKKTPRKRLIYFDIYSEMIFQKPGS